MRAECYQSVTRVFPGCSQSGPRVVPKWFKIGPRLVPDWFQNGLRIVLEICPRVVLWWPCGSGISEKWVLLLDIYLPCQMIWNCITYCCNGSFCIKGCCVKCCCLARCSSAEATTRAWPALCTLAKLCSRQILFWIYFITSHITILNTFYCISTLNLFHCISYHFVYWAHLTAYRSWFLPIMFWCI